MISAKAVLVHRITLHGNGSSTASFDGVELFSILYAYINDFFPLMHWERYAPDHFIRISIILKDITIIFCIVTFYIFPRKLY
jgi:hypothetical protein